MSVGLSVYMNKTIKITLKVAGVLGIFILTFISIKTIEHKSTIIVDGESIECYSDCNEVVKVPLDDTKSLEEINEYKLANFKRILEETKLQIEEDKRIAEEKRLADIEAQRIAKQKADEEAKKQKERSVVVSRGSQSNEEWTVYEATHYSPHCNTGCIGVTKLGWDVSNTIYHDGYRVIAVDPNKIKLGSLVEVQTSYGTFKALAGDTGGAIKGYRIDILVENDDVAYELGREKVQVRVIQ